jgi:hypothetical protein
MLTVRTVKKGAGEEVKAQSGLVRGEKGFQKKPE